MEHVEGSQNPSLIQEDIPKELRKASSGCSMDKHLEF